MGTANGKQSQKRKRGEGFTAQQLQNLDLPEPEWIIPGLLPEGAGLLVGRPKVGKSYMALGLALAVAQGGTALGAVSVTRGEVLYLALEDGPRRLKRRFRHLLGDTPWPASLHLYPMRQWPRLADGGLQEIASWLGEHPDARLVVVDTLQRFRGARERGGDLYAEDYEALGDIQEVAENHRVAIPVLHHQRKQEAEDPLDTVMGTTGVTGGADFVWILERPRAIQDGKLTLIGRDLEDQELAVRFDPTTVSWTALGDADRYAMSQERREIIDFTEGAGMAVTAKDVAQALGKKETSIRNLMWRMSRAGQLEAAHGSYAIPRTIGPGGPEPCPVCGGGDPDCATCGSTWLALQRRAVPPTPGSVPPLEWSA